MDDLISRQAVIDACDQSINLFEAVDRIKELPSVNPQKPICPSAGIDCEDCPAYEPKTGWIPVSESLPEIHQDVLLSLRSLDVEVGFRGNTEPYYYCHGGYIEPQNVLAWQPLPEPYKAEGSDE